MRAYVQASAAFPGLGWEACAGLKGATAMHGFPSGRGAARLDLRAA